jgi:hypothetical protein
MTDQPTTVTTTKRIKCGQAGACWKAYAASPHRDPSHPEGVCQVDFHRTSAESPCDLPPEVLRELDREVQELRARLRAATAAYHGKKAQG